MAKLIAVTGGIGSGKSIVCKILHTMGYKIYDCDSRAKALMDNSESIKVEISKKISNDAINNGIINRQILAKIVFSDSAKLHMLNKIVHSAIREDILSWQKSNSEENILFIETAILYQSKIDTLVDEVWDVTAPIETRIKRVMARNNVSRKEVISRIESQKLPQDVKIHANTFCINNDGIEPIIPQIIALL